MKKIKVNFLGLPKIFYRESDNKFSFNFGDLVDYDKFELCTTGTAEYLDFGYSVFGITPVRGIKYVLPGHDVVIKDGCIIDICKTNQFYDNGKWLEDNIGTHDVIELLEGYLKANIAENDVILPLSGGRDSRLLAHLTRKFTNVECFTYGTNAAQYNSAEVFLAAKYAKLFNLPWSRIHLNNYFSDYYVSDWLSRYSTTTHLHGMYHIDFYDQILARKPKQKYLVSGIIGDVWAGLTLPNINGSAELSKLSYSHGISIDVKASIENYDRNIRDKFFKDNRHLVSCPRGRIILAMQMKMQLLRYLIEVPGTNFRVITPFLDSEIVIKMLSLTDDLRSDRKWQNAYFENEGIEFNLSDSQVEWKNDIDLHMFKNSKIRPLNPKLFRGILSKNFINDVNKGLFREFGKKYYIMKYYSGNYRGSSRMRKMLRLKDRRNEFLNKYLLLFPLQDLLSKRV